MVKLIWMVVALVVVAGAAGADAGEGTDNNVQSSDEEIVLCGGCFWGIELGLSRVPGVRKTIVGYGGGDRAKGKGNRPRYEQVARGRTRHAECVKVSYNSESLSLDDLLSVFFSLHDPGQLNRKGGDVGPMYRSMIIPRSDEQRDTVARHIENLRESRKVVTTISDARVFYAAEDYHQKYLEKAGQSARKGDLSPIHCYGNRPGPVKDFTKMPRHVVDIVSRRDTGSSVQEKETL